MSVFQQTEQSTPTAPGANTQLVYPKVGGQFVMAADGIEKQILDSRSAAAYHTALELNILLIGGF
jgi:hypothetical protein